jgi:putative ABC transport system ATP-binding protein
MRALNSFGFPQDSGAAARAESLSKVYGSGSTRVRALDGVDVEFTRGQFTAIMGPSGSGCCGASPAKSCSPATA